MYNCTFPIKNNNINTLTQTFSIPTVFLTFIYQSETSQYDKHHQRIIKTLWVVRGVGTYCTQFKQQRKKEITVEMQPNQPISCSNYVCSEYPLNRIPNHILPNNSLWDTLERIGVRIKRQINQIPIWEDDVKAGVVFCMCPSGM